MSDWRSLPEDAWLKYIKPHIHLPKWVEDSSAINSTIDLNKRELFSLVILAHMYTNNDSDSPWYVGYDSRDSEPNDGYVTDGENKIQLEHKLVAQMDSREVLKAIIETYDKYAKRGKGYGENRVLIIQPNKASSKNTAIRISDLKDNIGDSSHFDKVMTISLVTYKGDNNTTAVIHIIEHYPREEDFSPGKFISQVELDMLTGKAKIPHKGID